MEDISQNIEEILNDDHAFVHFFAVLSGIDDLESLTDLFISGAGWLLKAYGLCLIYKGINRPNVLIKRWPASLNKAVSNVGVQEPADKIILSELDLLQGYSKETINFNYRGTDLGYLIIAYKEEFKTDSRKNFIKSNLQSIGTLIFANLENTYELKNKINELEIASKELTNSKAYSDLIFTLIPSAIFTVDNEKKITAWNKKAELITGFAAEEVIGKDCAFSVGSYCSTPCVFKDTSIDKSVLAKECRIRTKDGRDLIIYKNLDYLRDSSKNIIGGIESFEDITEQKNYEKELKNYSSELERSNKDLEQFAYVASHDLQEPLRMITNYTKLLLGQYRNKFDQKAEEFLNFIFEGSKRMQSLITGLLRYAKIKTTSDDFVITDLELVLKYVLDDLAFTIEDSKARITYDKLPVIKADPVQISHLFQNLIGNAIKFKGSKDPEIHISAERKDEYWLFSVKDNGIGINMQFNERIFQIFQRLHEQTAYPGTGIGLALCKKIVENLGGRIWVESGEGKGSTFFFTVPQ